ncbi:hypothetical protein AAFF_G00201050 [Aldrovandia affinis]|uniref:Uncharacterized protein n=1 Tax=Aldrovandia affinis TaxID=143900 RepID=A0AAD7RI81_9TELE|nr:hypothetical protein AAFF_G00201050 [Aldrovandia affinis]
MWLRVERRVVCTGRIAGAADGVQTNRSLRGEQSLLLLRALLFTCGGAIHSQPYVTPRVAARVKRHGSLERMRSRDAVATPQPRHRVLVTSPLRHHPPNSAWDRPTAHRGPVHTDVVKR